MASHSGCRSTTESKKALEQVPPPKGASPDCDYYFWTGSGTREVHVRTVERTLLAVFRKSKVPDAHVHRFRHTLATEILATAGTIEDAANILGDSPATIRKHYAK
jgi:integrase